MPSTTALLDSDPRQVSSYRLQARIAAGGQGVVYLALEPEQGREVAVKVLHADLLRSEEAQARFLREVESARRVPQFFTARVLDHGVGPHGPFVVSELVDGPSLHRAVKQHGPYEQDSLLRLAMGTASALATIHAAGVVHRDFKPSNVMLGPDGPRVIDFGTARSIDITATRTAGLIGTLPYMSPEQASGEWAGAPTDLFSWAVTMLFAATGEPVFGKEFPGVLHRIISTEPELPALPEPLDRLVPECLAKDPKQRPTASQVMLALVGQSEAAAAPDRHAASSPAPIEAAQEQDAATTLEARSGAVSTTSAPGETPSELLLAGNRANRPPGQGRRSAAGTAFGRLRGRRPPRPVVTASLLAAVLTLVAVAALLATLLPAAEDPSVGPSAEDAGLPPGFDLASSQVVAPDSGAGSGLRVGMAPEPPSVDPGTLALPEWWNMARLYTRTLLTWSSDPEDGAALVPDLAEDLGEVSDDGLTWTYRISEDARYEDGTPVQAQDIAHAVERSYELADWTYSPDSVSGEITVPDATTIEFHLAEPFAEFDHLMATPQTAPVPVEAGEEELGATAVPATGPYRVAEYETDELLALEPNPEWESDSDPNRALGPQSIEITFAEEREALDEALRDGALDADVSPGGLTGSLRGEVLNDHELLAQADAPHSGALSYLAVSTGVEPFDEPACRAAVRSAVDRGSAVEALGGEAAATPAGAVLSPRDLGYQEVEPEEADPAAARDALAECGHEEGFSTGLAVRGDVPGDTVLARSLADDLAAVGISAEIRAFSAEEFEDTAAAPEHAEGEGLGLTVFTHRPWWPTGRFALLERAHGNWIRDSDNRNFSLWEDAETDELLARAQEERDEQARAELYAEVDALLREEAVLVPVAYPRTLLWRGEHLANVHAHPVFGAYDLAVLASSR